MEDLEAGRIAKTNDERAALAARLGWDVRFDAPELADRWRYALPFSLRGDQQKSFGVLSGKHQGVPFTAFDFHRVRAVKAVRDAWNDKATYDDEYARINTVWVLDLKADVPWFQLVENIDPAYDTTGLPEPITGDPNFNRWYRLVNTDPQVAAQVLHPELARYLRLHKLHTWALMHTELVFTTAPIFTRVKPDDLVATLDRLIGLVALLPLPKLAEYR
ncbi:hypothetical protein [Kribbella sp. NPDC051770]|uniref:hypothetical protein n=1 Tax=Kribbella sp. NPDC051770 TaxID=3155413 RepID=UPI003431C710